MIKLYCQNCYGPKGTSHLSEFLCEACTQAGNEAAEHAVRSGKSVSEARSHALLGRTAHPMINKQHPAGLFDRVNTQAFEERLALEPGSLDDPRRGTGR